MPVFLGRVCSCCRLGFVFLLQLALSTLYLFRFPVRRCRRCRPIW